MNGEALRDLHLREAALPSAVEGVRWRP
jgi:hypothetical protein